YLVVGARAVAFHARPRATKDLDILLEPTPANARNVLAVSAMPTGEAGFELLDGDSKDNGKRHEDGDADEDDIDFVSPG
ncbi:MAG: hypothetical protein HYU31_04840, partial [Deltaproteobacteria bacterium]|nr:hypothetical protein [Deltaproteobacteria bacterium]